MDSIQTDWTESEWFQTWLRLARHAALLLLLAAQVQAATTTYYIDWTGGNDANDGLTTGTAWKRAPRMKLYAGSHPVPQPGDRFIFKGGVTWPHDALKLRLTNSGTFADPIYYGIDTNWYTGASWSRPVFDCQDTVITDSAGTPQLGTLAAAILLDASSSGGQCRNIVIEGIEVRNHMGRISGDSSDGAGSLCMNNAGVAGAVSNIVIRSCKFTDWKLPSYSNGHDSGDTGGIVLKAGAGVPQYVTIEDCEFGPLSNPSHQSGSAVKSYNTDTFTFRRNIVHDLPGALVTCGGTIVSNFIYNIALNGATDPAGHENVIYDTGIASRITHNIFSNNAPPAIYCNSAAQSPGTGALMNTNTGAKIALYADNVIYQPTTWYGNSACISIDNESLSGGTSAGFTNGGVMIVNNTFYAPGKPAIKLDYRTGYPNNKYGLLAIYNNHIITNTAAAYSIDSRSLLNTEVYASNIVHSLSTANTLGMTLENMFRPSTPSSSTIGAAVDFRSQWPTITTDFLSVLRDASPDVGAYEFVPAAPGMTLTVGTVSAATVR